MHAIYWMDHRITYGSARARMQTNHTPDDRPDSNKPMFQPLRAFAPASMQVSSAGPHHACVWIQRISNLQRSVAYYRAVEYSLS
jgi:hypothetical protein